MTFSVSGRGARGGTIAIFLLALLAVSAPVAAMPIESASSPLSATPASAVTVDITATSSISFVPSSFSVSPGESVTVVVTQAADFTHTFTLSSVVNYTIPSTDTPAELNQFFADHPPLVNLSLGSTAGAQFTATFTAPTTPGTYEYVCLVHFPAMTGVMTDSSSSSPSSSGSSLSTTEIVAIGAGVAVVVIAAVVVVLRRGHRPPK